MSRLVVRRTLWAALLLLALATVAAGRGTAAAADEAARPVHAFHNGSFDAWDRPAAWEYFRATQDQAEQTREQAEQAAGCEAVAQSLSPEGFIVPDGAVLSGTENIGVCLIWDRRWFSYSVFLDVDSVTAFREAKAIIQSRLSVIDVSPCSVAIWTSVRREVRRQITPADRYGAGTRCAPAVIAHGPASAARVDEVEFAIAQAMSAGEGIFGFAPTWPLRVHIYDTLSDYVEGARNEGGDPSISARTLETAPAFTGEIANGMRGFLINISAFPRSDDLQMLIAHEWAHVAQLGTSGCTCNLPWFALEGGAEYFAALVVGPHQRLLSARYEQAVNDAFRAAPVTLLDLIDHPPAGSHLAAAGYSRGLAAFTLLEAWWGAGTFSKLHHEAVGGGISSYIAAMERLTGLSLERFDQALTVYLRDPVAPPSLAQGVITPYSLLTSLVSYRVLADRLIEAGSFGPDDSNAVIMLEWGCLSEEVLVDAVLERPDGTWHSRFRGAAGPDCGSRNRLDLEITPEMRAYPGFWRLRVHAVGYEHGNITIAIDP